MDARARHRRHVLVAIAWALFGVACGSGDRLVEPSVEQAVEHRGAVVVAGTASLAGVPGIDARRVVTGDPVDAALRGSDVSALPTAMRLAGSTTLVVERGAVTCGGACLAARIDRRAAMPDFRYRVIGPDVAVLEPYRPPAMTAAERGALARIARQLLRGGEPPRLGQFPAAHRAPVSVEVLLEVLRGNGQLALWRSARASSLASGLLSATHEARSRWEARSANLGGELDEVLRSATVRVSLLVDDGTFMSRSRGFLDAALTPDHGPAFDRVQSWHYLLPWSDARRGKTGSQAFDALFRDNRLPVDAANRADLRLYRIRVIELATSPPADEP